MISLNKKYAKFIRVDPDKGRLYALKVNEEECNTLQKDLKSISDEEFKIKYRREKTDIVLFGDVLTVDKDVFKFVCDYKVSPDNQTVYRCFTQDSLLIYNKTKINLHENLESSWNCFIEFMYYPTHVILYYDNSI
jgi:hypothetical protein